MPDADSESSTSTSFRNTNKTISFTVDTSVRSVQSGESSYRSPKFSPTHTKFPRRVFGVATKGAVHVGKTAQILNSTDRPKGAVPPNGLNTWKQLTPDVKLPDIRDRTLGEIYYTRGRVGQKLSRKKQEFDVSDPYNRRTAPEPKEYSALHDPHCKSYFRRPTVMKHLKQQELVNNKGEVLCNVNQFNQYRSYLSSMFNEQVRRRIAENDAMSQMEKGIQRAICFKSRQARSQQRSYENLANFQTKHRLLNSMYTAANNQKHKLKIQDWRKRVDVIERNKCRVQIARSGEYTMRHWNAYLTRKKADKKEEKRKKHTLTRIAYAEVKNEYVTKYDKFVKLALFERYKADQAAIMIARDDQVADMEQLVAETIKRGKENWLRQYNTFIENSREHPIKIHEKHLYQEKRTQFLMKKYFNKWRQIVIANRENVDELHYTVFEIRKNKLRPLVADIKSNISPQAKRESRKTDRGQGGLQPLPAPPVATRKTILPAPPPRVDRPGHGDHHRNLKKPRRSRFRHSIDHSRGDGKGNEADLDEADEYIDQVVSQYALENDLLSTKLKGTGRQSSTSSHHQHSRHLHTANSDTALPMSGTQEEQKDRIEFLSDINLPAHRKTLRKAKQSMNL